MRTSGLLLTGGHSFSIVDGTKPHVSKERFSSRWLVAVPAKSRTDLVVWAPMYYLAALKEAYCLDERYGARLYSYAMFLAKSLVAFRLFGREGVRRYIRLKNAKIRQGLDHVDEMGYSPVGLAVAASYAKTLGWSIFRAEDLVDSRRLVDSAVFPLLASSEEDLESIEDDIIAMLGKLPI